MAVPISVKALYDVLDRIRRILIVSIFSFIVLSGALEIFLRYTPGLQSLSWSDEIMRYLNIWLIFLGAGLAAKTNTHMAMDFFVKKFFPASLRPLIRRITLAVVCAALLALTVVGIQKTLSTTDVMIQAFDVPIALFYAAIPLGCFLMTIEYLLLLVYGDHPFLSEKGETR